MSSDWNTEEKHEADKLFYIKGDIFKFYEVRN